MNAVLRIFCMAGLLATAGLATADPIAFSANETSSSVSVVDVSTGTVRSTISVQDNFAREPKDLAIDPKSGRVFVAADGQLISFDGRVPDGRGLHRVPARAEGSSVAIDDVGRRVFMVHEEDGQTQGVVSEFSIANPAQPTFVAEHFVPGLIDLRQIAWDRRYGRLYVVDDTSHVARTGQGDLVFAEIASLGNGQGGILADPAGGVWVTIRASTTGKLVRIAENGTTTEFPLTGTPKAQPRGMAWDVLVPGTILIAVDDAAKVKRFTPSSGAFADVMSTDARPQDVGVTPGGVRVSVNRIASSGNGSMTKDGAFLAATGERPVAIAVADLARLTADPPQKSFCWNQAGDRADQTFTVQNTRVDRADMNLQPVTVGGSNPANYVLVGANTCSSARLTWGQTCTFTLRFTASGPSIQPPPPFSPIGGPSIQIPYWPAEAVVAGTSNSGTTHIPLRGSLSLNRCTPLPVITPLPRPWTLGP